MRPFSLAFHDLRPATSFTRFAVGSRFARPGAGGAAPEEITMRPCMIALSAVLAGLSLPVWAVTADELVAKNLQARGGADQLRAITSMHSLGKLRLGGGLEAKAETFAVAPDGPSKGMIRFELSLQGLTQVNAWDGTQGWIIDPFQGRRDPQKLSGDDTKDLARAADIAGPLLDAQKKGEKIEYLGTEDIDGTDAHKLRVTFKNGDTRVIYLDPDQFLEIRVVDHRSVRGQEQVQTTDLGEYEKIDGVYFPFEQGQLHIESAELNKPIDTAMFSFPTAKR
jgi:hypothetical protein